MTPVIALPTDHSTSQLRPLMRVISLVLCLLVAGCSAPQAPSEAAEVASRASLPTPAFGAPVDLAQGKGGPEPIVVVADDGTLIVASQDRSGGAPHVWTLRPDGTPREAAPSTQSGGEVDVATGPGGLTVLTQLGPQGNIVTISKDRGLTWSSSPLSTIGTQYFDREWAAIDARGRILLVARQFGEDAAAIASRSDDGGVTFLARGRAWDATNEPGLLNGNLLAAGDLFVMPYVCREARALCAAASNDGGTTWRRSLVVERDVSVDNVYPVVAADAGRLLVTWSDSSSGRLAAYVSESRDGGASWGAPVQVSGEDESATLPWVAARAGRTWVCYVSTTAELRLADEADAAEASWRAVATRLDGTAPVARGPLLADPVHDGVISKPLGRPGAGGPYDRSFADFYSCALGADGKLVAATPVTTAKRGDVFLVEEA